MIEVIQFPVLSDNYTFMIHNEADNRTAVIDPALAEPVLATLKEKGWQLDYIVNTHHHFDHTDGNMPLKQATGAKIIGYKHDAKRIPGIDIEVDDGEKINICGEEAEVIFVPGHTLGHIAYYFAESGVLFCGDTIFSLGCGRLFEGTAEQMYNSLNKLKNLPGETKIYCAHEYTEANGKFALTIEPDNVDLQQRMEEVRHLRKQGKATIPTVMELELATNTFLRAGSVEEFAERRRKKDGFR